MAENAREHLSLDTVLFAPAGSPPHKPDQELACALDRLAMIRLAIADRPCFESSTIDLDRDGPSFTWMLLERVVDSCPGAEVTFIMGGDSLQDFATWARPERILELARLAVIQRPGFDARFPNVSGLLDRLDLIESPMCDVSSTGIRERVGNGESIRYLVPEPVRDYIDGRGLYR